MIPVMRIVLKVRKMNKKQKKMLWRILIAAALMIVLHFLVKALGDKIHEPL